MHQRLIAGGGCLGIGGVSLVTNFNLLFSLILLAIGVGIFVTDYHGKAPPFELI
jgi:hypothetical protein